MVTKQKRIRVLFIIPSLRAGGAERVTSFIVQNLSKEKFDPHLLVVGFEADNFFQVKGATVHYLNKKKVSNSVFGIIRHIKKTNPNIVVSVIGHVNILLSFISLLFPKKIFVGREANVKSVRKDLEEKSGFKLRPDLHGLSLKLLDAIIIQSRDMLRDLKVNDNINEEKCTIINNPITDDFKYIDFQPPNDHINYITVGSLHSRKGHLRILEALSKVDHDFIYTIVGKGEFDFLSTKIEALNLKEKVRYIPSSNDIPSLLGKNHVFLNGSYVEGFSNAMLESCAVGVPVVAFNAPGGINEIIIEGINGYIANNGNEFVSYLNQINKSYDFDRKKVRESVTSRYSKKIILNQYENLFINLYNNLLLK